VRTRERKGRTCGGEGRGNATDLAARPEGQLLLDEIDELGAADQSVAVGVGLAEASSQLRLRRPWIGSRPSAHNGAAATPPRPRPRASWCALLLRNTLRLRARARVRARMRAARLCFVSRGWQTDLIGLEARSEVTRRGTAAACAPRSCRGLRPSCGSARRSRPSPDATDNIAVDCLTPFGRRVASADFGASARCWSCSAAPTGLRCA
jgi:hypothetical protein